MLFIRPMDEKRAKNAPRTTSHACVPPSGYVSSNEAMDRKVWCLVTGPPSRSTPPTPFMPLPLPLPLPPLLEAAAPCWSMPTLVSSTVVPCSSANWVSGSSWMMRELTCWISMCGECYNVAASRKEKRAEWEKTRKILFLFLFFLSLSALIGTHSHLTPHKLDPKKEEKGMPRIV